MATYTITIDENTTSGKALLEYLKNLGVVNLHIGKKSGRDLTMEAINELEAGKGIVCENFDDYKKKMDE